jgi:hypothetical protein
MAVCLGVPSGPKNEIVAFTVLVAEGFAMDSWNRPATIQWLRKAAYSGFPCYPRFQTDPMLVPLHDHPEFARLLAELRTAWEAAGNRYVQ